MKATNIRNTEGSSHNSYSILDMTAQQVGHKSYQILSLITCISYSDGLTQCHSWRKHLDALTFRSYSRASKSTALP